MPLEIVVPLAALAVVCLLRFVRGGRAPGRNGPQEAARRFVDGRIDEHIDRLAARYRQLNPGGVGDLDDIPPGFGNEIQSFIGEVLLRDVIVATGDEEVAAAVRELVVLERGYIYERVVRRIQDLESLA